MPRPPQPTKRALQQVAANPLLALAALGGAGLVTAWLLLAGFPFWAVAVAVGCLGAVGWLSWRFREPPREIIRSFLVLPLALVQAVAPLLLAALFLILYATRAVDVGYQFAAGVAFAAAVALVIGPEWRTVREAIQTTRGPAGRRRGMMQFVVWIVAVLAAPSAVLVVVFLFTPLWPGVEDFGGAPAAVELSGLLLLLLAAILRLIAFARESRPRWLATVAVGLCAVMIAAIWGFLPGSDGETALFLTDVGWLLFAAVALFVVAIYEAYKALEENGAARPRSSPAARLSLLGFACAFAGAAAVALALVLVGLDRQGTLPSSSATSAVRPGLPPNRTSALDDRQLAFMFTPVLALDSADKESWLPSTVNRFVEDARLLDLAGNEACPKCDDNPRLFTLPKECPTDEEACFILSCAEGDGRCADRQAGGDPDRTAIYARVARVTSEPRTFRGPTPWGESLTVIIQYWLFYPHNRWRAVTPVGYLTQEHEADWESITVGLSDERPLFVAYSAHCGGSWHEWEDVEVVAAEFDGASWSESEASTGLHPYVAVATGSHANYLGAWGERPPDWGTCKRIPEQATWALSYASNVRDRTASERKIRPSVRVVRGGHPAMAFAGRWGRSDVTSIGVFGTKPIGKAGKGPESPAHREIWRRPLVTIFCSRHWRPTLCEQAEA